MGASIIYILKLETWRGYFSILLQLCCLEILIDKCPKWCFSTIWDIICDCSKWREVETEADEASDGKKWVNIEPESKGEREKARAKASFVT